MFDIISMQLLIIQFAVQVCLRDEPSTGVIITIMTLYNAETLPAFLSDILYLFMR